MELRLVVSSVNCERHIAESRADKRCGIDTGVAGRSCDGRATCVIPFERRSIFEQVALTAVRISMLKRKEALVLMP